MVQLADCSPFCSVGLERSTVLEEDNALDLS